MNIKINKDFKEYKDELARGFSTTEIASIIAALAVALGVMYCIWRLTGLKPDLCVYIAVPSAIPILAIGFYKSQGMGIIELIKEIIYANKTKMLFFEAEEGVSDNTRIFTMTKKPSSKNIKRKKKEKQRRRK